MRKDLKRRKFDFFEFDFTVFILVTALTIFGIVMVFSASYYYSLNNDGSPYSYLIKQACWAGLGIILMLFFSKVNYKFWKKWALPFVLLSLAMLVMVLIPGIGIEENGAIRWLRLGPITVMPGEIAKLAVLVGTAVFLSRNPKRILSMKEGIIPLVLFGGIYFILILKQPNLSTAIVVFGIIVGIMIIAGLKIRYLVILGGSGVAFLVGGYMLNLLDAHQISRITAFMDPFKDELGEGYQVVQSLLALGSGGLSGVGIGDSIQKNLYLPEPQNDFILAIIGEEIGFIGLMILLIAYIALIYKGFQVAINAKDSLGMLLAGGVTGMVAIQVIMNVAVVTASMPCTGVTLPFISYGGNAMLIFMTSMGILLNVSRHQKKHLGEDRNEGNS